MIASSQLMRSTLRSALKNLVCLRDDYPLSGVIPITVVTWILAAVDTQVCLFLTLD